MYLLVNLLVPLALSFPLPLHGHSDMCCTELFLNLGVSKFSYTGELSQRVLLLPEIHLYSSICDKPLLTLQICLLTIPFIIKLVLFRRYFLIYGKCIHIPNTKYLVLNTEIHRFSHLLIMFQIYKNFNLKGEKYQDYVRSSIYDQILLLLCDNEVFPLISESFLLLLLLVLF